MIPTCDWDLGHNHRYTGTVAAAVASYGFPLATQRGLVDAWERRDFADMVAIDRDSIRGRSAEYDPGIRQMHFGGAGRVCAEVTRNTWAADHVEMAVVVCSGGECVAIPSRCLNVFRVTPLPARQVALREPIVPEDGVAPPPEPIAPPEAAFQPAEPDPEVAWAGGPPAPWWPYPVGGPVVFREAPRVSPVPEPPVWALLGAGWLIVWLKTRRSER